MLWKHPVFSGVRPDRFRRATVKMVDYTATFNGTDDCVVVSGKVIADPTAHSVVLIDDRGQDDQYWSRSYAAYVSSDGTFQLKINQPAKVNGRYAILFCLNSGLVTGDGAHIDFENRGEIRKPYAFRNGTFQFDRARSRAVEHTWAVPTRSWRPGQWGDHAAGAF